MVQELKFSSKSGKEAQGFTQICGEPPGWKVQSPGTILLHDWWGLDKYMRWQTERYTDVMRTLTVSPDFFNGKTVGSPFHTDEERNEAIELMKNFDYGPAMDIIAGAIEHIKTIERTIPNGEKYNAYKGKIALIGFGMGGGLALAAASQFPEVSAVVSFYGLPKPGTFDASKVQAEVMGHFVKDDEFAKPEDADKLKAELESKGKKVSTFTYVGDDLFPARRGFVDDFHFMLHQPIHAKEAWMQTAKMLREVLDVADDGRPLTEVRQQIEAHKKFEEEVRKRILSQKQT